MSRTFQTILNLLPRERCIGNNYSNTETYVEIHSEIGPKLQLDKSLKPLSGLTSA